MTPILHDANWYAIQVRTRWEFSIARLLENKGFVPFVPQYKTRRRWSDRKMELELPLFPGYIFCRFNPEIRLAILITPGVVRIVGTGGKLLPIPLTEMEALLQVSQSPCQAVPHPFCTVGAKIHIQKGPLAGLDAVVSGYKNGHVVFSVELVQRSISVELEEGMLTLPPQRQECAKGRGAVAEDSTHRHL